MATQTSWKSAPQGAPSAGSPLVDPSDVILRFLDSLGRRSEAEFYLGLFRAQQKERFATLLVESMALRHAQDAVVLDLRFLAGLGLVPVVVLGLYNPGASAHEQADRLCLRLDQADVKATLLLSSDPDLPAKVTAAARAGQIPVVPFVAPTGQPARTRFDQLGALLGDLHTRKLIVLGRRSGLRIRGKDADLPVINLATDYDALVAEHALSPKELFLLTQAKRILTEHTHHRMAIAVTSPLGLLRELFTVKGSGTLIKRGSAIAAFSGYGESDLERLRALLESSFGRQLDDRFFERPISRLFVEEHYLGAALVAETPIGAYLTKFAVEREAQGEGMGRDLWQVVTRDYPVLFWRSRPGNPINSWYLQECDGMVRSSAWQVFWKGVGPSEIPRAIEYALAAPSDFLGEIV